jgi:hypothetical protein
MLCLAIKPNSDGIVDRKFEAYMLIYSRERMLNIFPIVRLPAHIDVSVYDARLSG